VTQIPFGGGLRPSLPAMWPRSPISPSPCIPTASTQVRHRARRFEQCQQPPPGAAAATVRRTIRINSGLMLALPAVAFIGIFVGAGPGDALRDGLRLKRRTAPFR
jgi:hypothetical protein